MRKQISVILVVLMMLAMLTGCSTDEFGYLQLQKEMAKIKQYQFMNTTKVSLGEEFLGERLDASISMVGEANVENYKDMYLDAVLNMNYNNYVGQEQVEVKLTGNKLYVSPNLFNEANNFYIEQGIDDPEFSKQYNKIKEYDYAMIYDLAEDMETAPDEDVDLDVVYDEITTLMNKMFKEFDSKLVKEIANGYRLEITADSGKESVNNLVKYIKDNRKEILGVFETGAKEIADEAQMKQVQEILDEVEQSLNELDTIVTPEMVDAYAQMLKGSELVVELTDEGDSYCQGVYLKLVVDGVEIGSMTTVTSIVEADILKTPIEGKILTQEMLNEITGSTEVESGQVYEMKIKWTNKSDETNVEAARNDGLTAIGKSNYVIIEDRVYLPLRYTGETLGEEVGWDNDLRQAYVMRNGERIDMTGVIVNDKTMVKIRDFEKLGYTVSYQQVDGVSTAIISDYNKMTN